MTSGQKSSKTLPSAQPVAVETLAGAFHPHAIEVQEFSHYALVVDVRPLADFEEDHIPGAVQLTPPPLPVSGVREDGATAPIPAALATLAAKVKPDRAILLYCGRGGLDSLPLAKALRWHGWTVDVLPGGWINYRRWVEAGLEVLPRLLSFRVISSPLGGETARVLRALQNLGQQVVDVEQMAGWRRGALFGPTDIQASQAWFESRLLKILRGLDPRKSVWVGDVGQQLGSLALPRALHDAMATAPTASLQVELSERLRCWKEDEELLAKNPRDVVQFLERLSPRLPDDLLTMWGACGAARQLDVVLGSVLQDYLGTRDEDRNVAQPRALDSLPPLVVSAFTPTYLETALRTWLSALATLSTPR
jgi:tRNA 2-selenouridine synthase